MKGFHNDSDLEVICRVRFQIHEVVLDVRCVKQTVRSCELLYTPLVAGKQRVCREVEFCVTYQSNKDLRKCEPDAN